MEIPIYFPNLKKGSTKDSIMQLLTIKKSLPIQKIYLSLKKDFKIVRSYQTIRQALLELVEDGVLEKKDKAYSISIDWIRSMDDYISLLKKRYVLQKKVKIIDKNTKEIEIDSLYNLGHFILYSFRENFFDANEKDELFMFVHHLWFPFASFKKRNLLREFFASKKSFVYVSNSSFGDRILSAFYSRYCRLKFGVKLDDFNDFIIQGDCIARIYMPAELRKRMHDVYTFRKLSFNVIEELSDLTYSKYKIKIVITRDSYMADEMKSQLKSYR
jgi:hypothetical protein